MKRRDGFTLIEMMISVAVLGILTVYMTWALLQQSRGYEVVDDVAEAQQSERAIGDLLEHDVLATGMLAVAGAVVSGVDNTAPLGAPAVPATDVLCVTDPDTLANPASIGEGTLGVRIVAGYAGTGTSETLTLSVPTLEQQNSTFVAPVPAYDNDNPPNGVADSDFFYAPGTSQAGGVIVADPTNPGAGSQCGLITRVTTGGATTVRVDWRVTVDGRALVPNPLPVAAASRVVVPAHIYYVRPGTAPGVLPARAPQLMRDGMMIADDVEDLQVAYFHDGDSDGACDANEWSGGDCPLPGLQGFAGYQANAKNNCLLRALRVNFVVRTASQDAVSAQNAALASGAFVQTENAPARAGLDGFRRRVFTRTMQPRNAPINSGSSPRGCV